jgi:integrase
VRSTPHPLNDIELAEVVKAAPENWKPVLLMLAYTGLRWGELRALRWRDVRESPYPHMVVSKSHDGPTKSRKVREVPLLPEAQDVLDSLTGRTGTVFSLPETASWIRRHVIGHSRVKDFHVHRLRHTFACRYLERGGSLEALQRMLGHSTVRLTERYGRLRPEVVAAEVRRVGRDGTVDGTVTVPSASEACK